MRQGATPAKHEPGRPGGVREPFGGGAPQGPLEQRVGGGVGLAERDADLEAGRPDETLREVGGWGTGSGLYPPDRRRRDARAPGQLRPGESGPLAGFVNEMRDGHDALIAIRQSVRQVLVTG